MAHVIDEFSSLPVKINREQVKHRAADPELLKQHYEKTSVDRLLYARNPRPSNAGSAQQKIAVSYPGIAGYNIPFWVTLDTGEFKSRTGSRSGLDFEAVRRVCKRCYPWSDFAHVMRCFRPVICGADVVIIGTGSNSMSAGVIAVKEIKSYQDLKGKRVGIASFGNNDTGLSFAFNKNGINPIKT